MCVCMYNNRQLILSCQCKYRNRVPVMSHIHTYICIEQKKYVCGRLKIDLCLFATKTFIPSAFVCMYNTMVCIRMWHVEMKGAVF